MINNQPICISLFTGAYGLDLGLEQAGFHTVSVVEKDKDAVKTIALNRPYLQESAIPRELEIAPYIPNELVAVFYIHTPAEVVLATDTIPFPAIMMNVLVSKALNYISIKQNNGTNLRGTTDQELLSLLGAVE